MEQFKKWRDHHSPGEMAYPRWEDAWKAALEWVLNNYPDDAIYEIIKKELGNE